MKITRVGPDIRQCRIIRPDFSFCRIFSQIIRPDFQFCRISGRVIRHIRPDLAGTRHPASGKKYQIRPNPNIYIYMVGVHLPLSRLPVYFCFSSPSISAYLPRLQSFISPTIASHFPDYSFFASLPLLYCFISPIIVLHLLLKNIRKYIFIFFTI